MQQNKQQQEKDKLENVIQNEIFDFLLEHNYYFWRQNNMPVFQKSGGSYRYRALPKHTPRGIPDIFILHMGKFIGVEVKTKYRKLTEQQAYFGLMCIKNGGYYLIARSVEDLVHGLNNIIFNRDKMTDEVYKNVPKEVSKRKLPKRKYLTKKLDDSESAKDA